MSNPWKYKAPLLISFTYLFLLSGNVTTEKATTAFIASLLTIFGFAGFGYLTNDLSDRSSDALAGKENATSKLSKASIYSLLILFLVLAILPWYYLPFDSISIVLIASELVLFVIYAFPPFRLKEKGVFGLITDALYAHVVPAILASYTFILVSEKNFKDYYFLLSAILVWQFFSGLRNILSHQLKDYPNDLESHTKTFVTKVGKASGVKVMNAVIVFEAAGFLFFSWHLYQLNYWYIYCLGGYGFIAVLQFFILHLYSDEPTYKRVTNIFLDNFYVLFLPLLLLIAMIPIKTEVTYILAIHLIVFRNGLKTALMASLNWFRESVVYRWLFNYESYTKGLVIHTMVFIVYYSLFAVGYFWLEANVTEKFMWTQRIYSKGLIVVILIHTFTVVWLRKKQTIDTFKSFVLEKGSAYNLAIFRILIFTIILGSFYGEVFGVFEEWTHLPDSERQGLPLIGWLIEILPITPELYRIVATIGAVLAVSILIGFKTRWALLLYVPIALYLWGVPNFFGKLNHRHIMVWVPIVLSFSRCGDVLSIDYLIKKLRKKATIPVQSAVYAMPFKIIWMLLAVIYCCSGFHKLWDTGLFWALSDNLVNQIQLEWVENYDTITAIRIDRYPALLSIFASGVIIMEIIYPLFIFKARTRILALLSAWSLHLSAGYFLFIDFFHLRIVNLSYINWSKWMGRILGRGHEIATESPALTSVLHTPLVYVGGSMIAINLLFGIVQINSWPFSSYPSYSNVVPREVDILSMHATDENGQTVDVKAIAKNAHFRWETIRPFEERIAVAVHAGDTTDLQHKIASYWQLWSTKVDSLETVRRVEFNLETTPLAPEKRNEIIQRTYLGVVIVDE